MNRIIQKLTVACGLFGCALAASADPAVYRDNTMTIDQGVLINGRVQRYYTDIVLKTEADGRLRIESAKELPLVHIDDVTPVVVESNSERSVTLSITGYKSVPCVALTEPAVSYRNQVFTVLLAETRMRPDQICIMIVDPIELELPLEISELPKGNYHTKVNGKQVSFSLATDPLP
jgi:hypothetical protein